MVNSNHSLITRRRDIFYFRGESLKIAIFAHCIIVILDLLAKEGPATSVYTSLNSTYSGLQFCHPYFRSIFIRLAVVASQVCESCEIQRKFELMVVQGHPRSSILVLIESAYATSY